MTTAIVTVIITVRNGQDHLGAAVRSVQRQSRHDWALVLFDDGSTDETNAICRQFAADDRRIHMQRSSPIGRARALNAAISMTETEWIMILDADDVFHPEKIEHQMKICGRLGSACILSCDASVFTSGEVLDWQGKNVSDKLYDVTKKISLHNPLCHSGACFHRDIFERIGGYTLGQSGALDYRFYVDAVKAGAKLFVMEATLVGKRVHTGQSFERRNRISYLWAGMCTQFLAIRVLKSGMHYYVLALLRFVYGFIPVKFRLWRYC